MGWQGLARRPAARKTALTKEMVFGDASRIVCHMGSLKIRPVKIDGEERVPPNVMRLLCEMAEHRKTCFGCGLAWKLQDAAAYCEEGRRMMDELVADPNVSVVPD